MQKKLQREHRRLLLDTLHIVPYLPGDTSGVHDNGLAKAMTVGTNLQALGYELSPEDIVRLAASSSVESLFNEIRELVPVMKAVPMYPDFPRQVMDMPEAQFRFHQLLHYFSTYGVELFFGLQVDKGWLPDVKHTPKTRKDRQLLPYKVLELVPEDEICRTAAERILTRRERMTDPERQLILLSLPYIAGGELAKIRVGFKENLEILFEDVVENSPREEAIRVLSGLCQHTGDVMHNIHLLLRKHKYHFSTSEKRTLVKLLESYAPADFRGNLMQSLRKREQNLVVLAHLDYNRFATLPKHKEAVAALRDGTLVSWEGMAKRLITEKAENGLDFMARRPGYMLRMLNWLLNLGYGAEELTEALGSRAGQFSTRTLVRLASLFRKEAFETVETAALRMEKELKELAWKYDPGEYSIEIRYQDKVFEAREKMDYLLKVLDRQTDSELQELRFEAIDARLKAELAKLDESLAFPLEVLTKNQKRAVSELEEKRSRIDRDLQNVSRKLEHCQKDLGKRYRDDSFLILTRAQANWIGQQKAALEKQIARIDRQIAAKRSGWDSLREEIKDLYYRDGFQQASDQIIQKYEKLLADAPLEQEKILSRKYIKKAGIIRTFEKRLNEASETRQKELDEYHAKGLDQIRKKLEQEKEAEESRIRAKYEQELKVNGTKPKILISLLEKQLRVIETPLRGKKVLLDCGMFDLGNTILEADSKSMDGTYVPSGFAYRIPEEASRVRFYVYWNDRLRIDVDLHASALGPGENPGDEPARIHIGWNGGYNEHGITHSGDITHCDAAEYIDIDLNSDALYAFMNVDLFNAHSGKWYLSDIDECFVGMMAVKDFGEDVELYSPANSFFTHKIHQKTKRLYYGYVDIQNRFIRFVGKPNYLANASMGIVEDMRKIISLEEYLNILFSSQDAVRTDSPEEADLILTIGKSTNPDALSLLDANFFLDAV